MVVGHIKDVKKIIMEAPGVVKAAKQALIGPKEGWEGYVMRLITLGTGGCSPKHTHDWPHINYMVSGKGKLFLDGEEFNLEAGSFSYVPGGSIHQFSNASEEDFVFICIVPEEGDK